jgi:alpha-glucosidase (family GH31 glycosyl hydrolase)
LIDEEANAVLLKFSKLKNRLMPHIWTEARQAVKAGGQGDVAFESNVRGVSG